MNENGMPRVICKIDPALILPWLLGRLQSHQEPQREGRAYYLMFAKNKRIDITVHGNGHVSAADRIIEIRDAAGKKRQVAVAISVPPELADYGVSSLEDANRAIIEVERYYEGSRNPPCTP